MAAFLYLPVSQSKSIFDVVHGLNVIGIVWQRGEQWYASATHMSDDAIVASSRKEAAEALAKSLGITFVT